MKCKGKVRYADHEAAVDASKGLKMSNIDMRIYFCENCNGWHFTSKEVWGGKRQQHFKPQFINIWKKLMK
jgi:hypothetical protein